MATISVRRREALEAVASAAGRLRRSWEADHALMAPGKDPWDPAVMSPESIDVVRKLDWLATVVEQERRDALRKQRARRPLEAVS